MSFTKLFPFFLLVACNSTAQQKTEVSTDWKQFGDYWYQGEAELTSFELEQARYGEIRSGKAVLVFVTEPFSKSKQVKLDNPQAAGDDRINVMKLNFTKKFNTGIYPYSMMTSSFVPVSYDKFPDALKVTTTSQEWCGHTFTQLNHYGKQYRFRQFSYFESEGDVEKSIANEWLEDELWQRIKINPELLPTGEFKMLPATMYLRLSHNTGEPVTTSGSLNQVDSSAYHTEKHSVYTLAHDDRTLHIYFQTSFPYIIYGWEETYQTGFGGKKEMTTRAKRITTIKSPYWRKNSTEDAYLREELGLE